MLKAMRTTLQRRPNRWQRPGEAGEAAEDPAGEADGSLRAPSASSEPHPLGGKQHERGIDDQRTAHRELERCQADPRHDPGADGDADQAGDQHGGKPAPGDGVPDRGQRRDMAHDRGRGNELGCEDRLDGLQPERQRGQPGAEPGKAIDQAADQRASQDDGQRVPIAIK